MEKKEDYILTKEVQYLMMHVLLLRMRLNQPIVLFFQAPKTTEEWCALATQFEERWQFPNCLGAIDGKHIAITQPYGSGSFFFNYKKFHSMVLLGICNANYEFIYVHFGTNGRISDGGVIENTEFYKKLKSRQLNIPPKSQRNHLPFVFVADEAFALRPDLLKPFNVKVLDDRKRIFNYRLSRARRIIENAFGILVNRFGVLDSTFKMSLGSIEDVVLACCVLHNFLRKNIPNNYTPPGSIDVEDEDHSIQEGLRENLTGIALSSSKNASENAKESRELFTEFFNTVGSVSWQNRFL